MGTKYLFVLIPMDHDAKEANFVWDKLYNNVSSLDRSIALHRHNFPELLELTKKQKLDTLYTISDDISEYNVCLQKICDKIRMQIMDLEDGALIGEKKYALTVQGVPLENYVAMFEWDSSKYPLTRSIKDIICAIKLDFCKIDEEFQVQALKYEKIQSQLSAIRGKQNKSLADCDLSSFVKPGDIITSEYLVTLLVVVPKQSQCSWLSSYESFDCFVVPRSSKRLYEDNEYALFTVTLFAKVVDNFKSWAHDKGFLIRDFNYCPDAQRNQKQDLEKLLQLEETMKNSLLQLCYANFSEVFSSWAHLSAVFLLTESVLRYGHDGKFLCVLLALQTEYETEVRRILDGLCANVNRSYWNPEDKQLAASVGLGSELDVYPCAALFIN